MPDNCGLPDGVTHPHADRCYQAGYADGRRAALNEARQIVRDVQAKEEDDRG